jgi:TonB family protein
MISLRMRIRIVGLLGAFFASWLVIDAAARAPIVILPGSPFPNSAFNWPKSPNYDVPPTLIRGNAPIYPITQAWRGNSGEALVSFIVGADGLTHDVRVLRTTYPYFGSHTVLAVRAWKFEPARKNGRPVPVAIQLLMPFGSHK